MSGVLLWVVLAVQGATLESAVFAAQDARFAAMIARDGAYLEKALDPTLTYQHSTGVAQSKAEFIQAVAGGGLRYKAIDVLERKARRFGSVVIITGIYRLQASSASETIDTKAMFTDVYEARGKDFVQVAWQNTRIPQAAPRS